MNFSWKIIIGKPLSSNLGNYQSLYENMVNLLGKNMGIFDKDGKTLASSKINNKYNMLDFQADM